MSTYRATIERLTIMEHPNADALELAQVGLYRAVVAKGAYRTGDCALYLPEGGVLPDDLIDELGLTGKLAGKNKNRIKAVRLRGEISQGIVCRPKALEGQVSWAIDDVALQVDYAPTLGVEKWVPEIPPEMAGQAISGVDLLRWIEIENLQRYPNIFEPGELVVLTEKIHGSCLVTTLTREGNFLVSSKGLANNGIALAENDTNLYWRAARQYGLREKMERVLADNPHVVKVALYGEVYGAGVQDLHYGANARRGETIGLRMFDVRFEEADGRKWWMDSMPYSGFCELYGLPMVPVIWTGPFDAEFIAEVASGQTTLDGGHIREGVVIRPMIERQSDVLGGRAIAKYVSPEYLTRGGNATEYE